MKPLFGFVQYELGRTVWFNFRWWIAMMAVSVITVIKIQGIRELSRQAPKIGFNMWDGVFALWGDFHIVLVFFTPLFLYLVSDLPFDRQWGDSLKIRLGSRLAWWIGKCTVLFVSAAIFSAICFVLPFLFSGLIFPWSEEWSAASRSGSPFLNPAALSMSPAAVAAQAVGLLAAGIAGLGLLSVIVAMAFRRGIAGFAAATMIVLISVAALLIHLQPPAVYALIHPHLDINLHSFGKEASKWPDYSQSLLYWAGWIAVCLLVGLAFNRRRDMFVEVDEP